MPPLIWPSSTIIPASRAAVVSSSGYSDCRAYTVRKKRKVVVILTTHEPQKEVMRYWRVTQNLPIEWIDDNSSRDELLLILWVSLQRQTRGNIMRFLGLCLPKVRIYGGPLPPYALSATLLFVSLFICLLALLPGTIYWATHVFYWFIFCPFRNIFIRVRIMKLFIWFIHNRLREIRE